MAKKEILARLNVIGEALGLDRAEIENAATSDEALIDFTERHNQSLEWIVRGNPKVMICSTSEACR